jgi:two-component system, chemotaxis family, chemotaxis protein CheY
MSPPSDTASPALQREEASERVEDQLRQALGELEVAHHGQGILLEQTLAAAEHERVVIAEELHDGPMQQLAFLGYTIDLLELKLANGEIDEVVPLLRTVRDGLVREMGTLRRLMSELHLPADEHLAVDETGTETPHVPVQGPAEVQQLVLWIDSSVQQGPPRVLVVDDEAAVRKVLVAILAEHGFDIVAEAANGAEAVELAKRLEPDLVLMDVRMPTMDGKEATRLIRAHRPSSQIVLLSGNDDQSVVADCLAIGAFDLIAKSGPSDTLCESLERAWRLVREQQGTPPLNVLAH